MNVLDETKALRDMWRGFWSARVLLTANNLRIFDHLKKSKNAAEIARLIDTDPRATEILLDALTGLDLLKKSNDAYRNSRTASRLLVKGMPYYQGDILRHADHLWTNWSDLDVIVKSGNPALKSFGSDAFIRGMHNVAVMKAKKVIAAIGLKGVKRALDLGGGPGTYSIEMAKKAHSVTLFDLPSTIAIAKDIVGKTGIKNIFFAEGDFLVDDIGNGYDLVLISQVVHSFSAANNLKVLERAYKALDSGGRIAIQEFYLDASKTSPVQGALFSVNMLVNTHGGRCYSVQEMKKWLLSLGFNKICLVKMEESVIVLGRKK